MECGPDLRGVPDTSVVGGMSVTTLLDAPTLPGFLRDVVVITVVDPSTLTPGCTRPR